MFLDLPEPGRALPVAARALRPGGVLVGYVPTALQLKDTVDALQAHSEFGQIESFETLLHHWQVKGLSVRPLNRMVAHSAFIIIARPLAALPLQGSEAESTSPWSERADESEDENPKQ